VTATLGPALILSLRNKELVQNSLLKVVQYEKYLLDGRVVLRIHKVSLISQDPGHRFGNPIDFHDAWDEPALTTSISMDTTSTTSPIERVCLEFFQQQSNGGVLLSNDPDSGTNENLSSENLSSENLSKLYSCRYPVNQKPVDSKIPRNGWKIECHGEAPSPKCQWIPQTQPTVPETENTVQEAKPNLLFAPW
jgi:hypothetical protein